jgi:drug/metabolite transporter (DMT)-like permease
MLNRLFPTLALTFNALVWGLSWWPFRILQQHGVHPLWATAFIFAIALVVLWLKYPDAWRGFSKQPVLWVLMLATGLCNACFNWAVTEGDVVRVVILFYLMPAWVVLLAWPLLGEKPSTASLARLVLALAGVMVVLKTPQVDWPIPQSRADWLALLGGASFALNNVLLRKLHDAGPGPGPRMLAMFSGGTFLSLGVAMLATHFGLANSPPSADAGWLVWVALMSLGFLLGNAGLQFGASRIAATSASLIMLTEVLFASASSVALGAASLSAQTFVGGALVLLAALWASLS